MFAFHFLPIGKQIIGIEFPQKSDHWVLQKLGMGRYAVQYLHNIKQIEKIYVADVNSLSAKKFASHFDNRVEKIYVGRNSMNTDEVSKIFHITN